MAGLSRPPAPIQSKRQHSMRPPISRPSSTRAQQSLNARTQSGTISPADSIASTSVSLSPTSRHTGGIKRKERDFDTGGEESNIHVVVRCRGRNDREVRENSGVVVSTDGVKGNNVELSMGLSALSNKTYHFDRVFSPAADQAMIYDEVVTPILDEMLQGYNCTLFAYGQTGTGKTYTMSGEMSDTQGLLSDSAGIIPRVLHSLFAKLEAEEAESSVKCSFIELYNEELRDLLSLDDHVKLKIFEDGQKKGHSATVVQGMEESHVKNARAGIKLLQDGSHKRQVAATKCNDLSSRSHTVFTVTVYIKRTAEDGEDFVSAGKLNLVDLAGSENIQRSGAENKRAAEAGLINKSLLTLGRVINALVERNSHIPYRDSKLTRLLQDSLGGRTKTCIIATVSPAKSNLEETISTLDYAFRAKNIRNKPQINQMISKRALLRDFTTEIEKLKSELMATRQRNGVYLTASSYEEITEESESRRILGEEQKAKIETMEANLRNKVQELFTLTNNFNSLRKDNDIAKQTLEDTNGVLEKTEFVLENTRQSLAEETLLRKAHQSTEEQLNNVGEELISKLEIAVTDVGGLHSKIHRKSILQNGNRVEWESSKATVAHVADLLETHLIDFKRQQADVISVLSNKMQSFVQDELEKVEVTQDYLSAKLSAFGQSEKEVVGQSFVAKQEMNEILEEIKTLREDVKQKVGEGLNGLSAAAGRISAEVINELGGFHTQLHTSYSSLGRDFKNIFEELTKHLNAQKIEAENLRQAASLAATVAMEAEANASARLNACLNEERSQMAVDRKNLLSQITDLINKSGDIQDARWESKFNVIRDELSASTLSFKDANKSYNDKIDLWLGKEDMLIDEVMKSRDTLKNKMKKDWMAINEHNTSIQTTTKSVHEETIRIVDAQMKDMAVQMQALDDFVTRARSQNERHQESHVQSLQGLASTVKQSYSDIGDHFTSSQERVHNLNSEINKQTTILRASHPTLTSNVQNPLTELGVNISKSLMKEYMPTGETPQKIQYNFPTILPRTEPHEKLLAKLARPHFTTSPSRPLASPTKSLIYTDPPPSVPTPQSDDEPKSPGLREISLNVTANANANAKDLSRHSDPTLSLTALAIKNSVFSSVSNKLPNSENAHTGPPPLKRQATESKLPQKLGGVSKGGVVKLEGRENTVGAGRWLRSSPTE